MGSGGAAMRALSFLHCFLRSEPGSDAIPRLRLLLVPACSPDTLVLPSSTKVTGLLRLLIATSQGMVTKSYDMDVIIIYSGRCPFLKKVSTKRSIGGSADGRE